MNLENWDDLKFVLAMHRHGTMSAAARQLNTNVATVSRRLDRLSQELGIPLFEKRGQALIPTEAAERLATSAEGVDQLLRGDISTILVPDEDAEVTLQISAPPSVHAHFIVQRLPELAKSHPQVRLNLIDKVFAQGLGEADIQIRIGRPEGGRLKARKFRDYALRVYHGQSAGLSRDWVGLSQRYPDSDLLRTIHTEAKAEPKYRVEEMTVVRDMIHMTGLPGMVPDFLVSGDDRVVVADLPGNYLPDELWITYHETRQGDPVLRSLVNWIVESTPAN